MTRVTVFGPGGYDPTKPNNNIVEEYEQPDPTPQPLDPVGSLATLLAVESVLTVEDAANAVGLTPTDLVNEAQAWAAASA
jgi:hypothetical protein